MDVESASGTAACSLSQLPGIDLLAAQAHGEYGAHVGVSDHSMQYAERVLSVRTPLSAASIVRTGHSPGRLCDPARPG